jgi:hypothetical protein
MSQIILDLPEEVIAELKDRHISDESVSLVAVEAIKAWLRMEPDDAQNTPATANRPRSRFAESAIPFIDRLIDENRSLFERLARLPYDSD